MRSLQTIQKEIQEINKAINPKRTAIAWLDPNDGLVHTSQVARITDKTYTKEEYERMMKEKGFGEIIFVTWCLGEGC